MIAKLRTNRVRRTYLGGSRIDAFCRTPSPLCEQPCPEDWLASTTTAFNGSVEIEGEGLGRLEDGRLVKDVVGTLPILVKLLDSDERLVIQAHPTVPFAKKFLNSPVGKTECWYFLPGTDPNACVYLGFKPGVTREKWAAAIRANWGTGPMPAGTDPLPVGTDPLPAGTDPMPVGTDPLPAGTDPLPAGTGPLPAGTGPMPVGTGPVSDFDKSLKLTDYLNKIKVSAGDLVFVEGGLPHAIGSGCFMIELQEPSDLMVVAERWTPSGREIPESKRFGGLDWKRMLDVYAYDSLSVDEICEKYLKSHISDRKFDYKVGPVPTGMGPVPTAKGPKFDCKVGPVPTGRGSVPTVRCVVGPELTDKFQMWEMDAFRKNASPEELAIGGKGAIIIVTEGEGLLNGLAVRKGDRLVVKGESRLTLAGAARAVVCFGGGLCTEDNNGVITT